MSDTWQHGMQFTPTVAADWQCALYCPEYDSAGTEYDNDAHFCREELGHASWERYPGTPHRCLRCGRVYTDCGLG